MDNEGDSIDISRYSIDKTPYSIDNEKQAAAIIDHPMRPQPILLIRPGRPLLQLQRFLQLLPHRFLQLHSLDRY